MKPKTAKADSNYVEQILIQTNKARNRTKHFAQYLISRYTLVEARTNCTTNPLYPQRAVYPKQVPLSPQEYAVAYCSEGSRSPKNSGCRSPLSAAGEP